MVSCPGEKTVKIVMARQAEGRIDGRGRRHDAVAFAGRLVYQSPYALQ